MAPLTTRRSASWSEVVFVLTCAVAVVGVAAVQHLVVIGLTVAEIGPQHFVLPTLVGSFFGVLIVQIRRLRADVELQNAEIMRLNEELSVDLARAGQQLETAHRELEHGERLKVLGLLGAQTAHDFNNLLTVVTHSVELIEDADESGQHAEDTQAIRESTSRATALTARLLQFSAPTSNDSVTELDVVLRELEPILRKLLGANLELTIDPTADVPAIGIARDRLENSLINLVVNARDAMDEDGHVTIGAKREGDFVALVVADDGHGMSEETVQKALTPYFTTKATGTGLGLPAVRQAVEDAGGQLDVSSSVGRGTTVTLRLPIRHDTTD